MRSSKSRSRSKQNRSRSVGNIVNRVFDSSGPEGKVRGTPQQIIEKYNQLARDAQLGNDRVAAENFQQHAEHYTRMLGEALREMEATRQSHEQGQGGQQSGNGQGREWRSRDEREERDDQRAPAEPRRAEREEAPVVDEGPVAEAFAVVAPEEAESILVETPESGGNRPRGRSRKPRGERRDPPPNPSEAAE